jgi:shikimate kinase
MPIILIGFMGSGKSTVGRELARRLKRPFFDLDDLVERETGLTISAIFRELGESYFRILELLLLRVQLREATASTTRPPVIATGGGIVTTPAARELLRQHHRVTVVYLQVEATTASLRVAADGAARPLLGDNRGAILPAAERQKKIQRLLQCRRPWYEACARLTVPANDGSITDIADQIIAALGTPCSPR